MAATLVGPIRRVNRKVAATFAAATRVVRCNDTRTAKYWSDCDESDTLVPNYCCTLKHLVTVLELTATQRCDLFSQTWPQLHLLTTVKSGDRYMLATC